MHYRFKMRLFVGKALRSRLTNTGNDLVPDSVNPVKDRFVSTLAIRICRYGFFQVRKNLLEIAQKLADEGV